jgi:GNAT superfamily N-acetyltransferase
MGLNYTAVDQTVDDTAQRIGNGLGMVAQLDGRIVATMTLRGAHAESRSTWYRRHDVASLHQFAVEPALHGNGIGTRLIRWAEDWARAEGFVELALDTAGSAAHLVAYYTARGFRVVESVQWAGKRYRSVILSKPLAA